MRLEIGIWFAAAVLGGAVAAGAAEGAPAPAPNVTVAPAAMVRESASRRYVGTVEPVRHVDIMPRVTGTLLKIHFEEGGTVAAGDLLYELEDTTYRAQVDSLRAQKEEVEAQLAYATTEFERSSRLLKSNAVSVSAHDKAAMDIASARARIKQLEAALADAENTLSYTRIHAPVSGRIGKSEFTVGSLITPQSGKLTDIEMMAPIHVRFSLSERVFRRDFGGGEGIRRNALVRVRLADGTLYGETAPVRLVDNKIHATTNTITLWAVFENRDRRLLPGGFVTVLLSARTDRPAVGILPSALIAGEKGYSVYVLDRDNKVAARPVETGDLVDGLQLIRSGLDGTERVVTDGMHKVRPGMTVVPHAPAPETKR